MKARGYPIPGADLMQVATLIAADLSRDSFDARIFPLAPRAADPGLGPVTSPGLVVEVRRVQGMLQRTMGQVAVLKAWLTPTPLGFSVRVGTDRATDAAAGAVEWLLATPALVTEGYAAFQQAQVDERIFRVVDHWVTNVARVPIPRGPAAVPTVGPCPSCRTPLPYGARFCPKCAHDTQSRATFGAGCPTCRGDVALEALFCPHCGAKVAPGQAPPATAPTCARCTATLEPGAGFCSECGARQATT